MATLPGIDANDPRKTLACFRFYCIVLSSVGMLQARNLRPLTCYVFRHVLLHTVFTIPKLKKGTGLLSCCIVLSSVGMLKASTSGGL